MASTESAPPTGAQTQSSGQRRRGRGRGRGGGGSGGGGDNDGGGGGGGGSGNAGTRSNNNRGSRRGRGGRTGANGATPHTSHSDGLQSSALDRLKRHRQQIADAMDARNALAAEKQGGEDDEDNDDDDDDAEVCFICATTPKYYALTSCNHRTCHICGLRMRALYQSKDCPTCRTSSPFVVFTDELVKRYEDFTESDISTIDRNIGIRYANEDIVGDTVLLLRYNCPLADCDFAGLGWPDLHRHVRSTHSKKMCDVCTRNKKVFTHEHSLFSDKELERHMRHGDDKPGDVDQTGFTGHPLCTFCGQRFYDDEKLFEHCRERHERCFLCDRRDSSRPHWYKNYEELERHFAKDHYMCNERECLEKKFQVFDSDLDLKAHALAEHGSSMSKELRRDARTIDMRTFDFRESYHPASSSSSSGGGGGGRRGGGGGGGNFSGRDGRGGTGRGRDPNVDPLPATSSTQPLRRDELAFHRQLALQQQSSSGGRSFGGQLTTASPTPAQASGTTSQNRSGAGTPAPANTTTVSGGSDSSAVDTANMTPEQRSRLMYHTSVVERASRLLNQDSAKLNTFRQLISSYRTGGHTPGGLLDALFTLFASTASSNSVGVLIREVADLYEDKAKAEALRKALQDWRAINEDYPTLPGLGGMEGATTSSSGWARAAATSPAALTAAPDQRYTNRVLKLKNSTRRNADGSASSAAPISWNAASASGGRVPGESAFPALPAAAPVPGSTPATSLSIPAVGTINVVSRTPSRSPAPAATSSFPPLSASAATISTTTQASSSFPSLAAAAPQPANPKQKQKQQPLAVASRDAFPGLPPAAKPAPTSMVSHRGRVVRSDFGVNRETGFSWGKDGEEEDEEDDEGEGEAGPASGGGKKGGAKKKKQKVLLAWG